MLTAARIAIYPVEARGLWTQSQFSAGAGYDAADTAQGSENSEHFDDETTMRQVADDTGGKAFLETNDFGKAVASAIDDGSGYYTLAYIPPAGGADGKFHKITVRLDNGKGLKLAYRRGYYAEAPGGSRKAFKEAVNVFAAALSHESPGATGVLFSARVLPASDPAFDGVSIPVAPSGEKPSAFKGPPNHYIIDLTLDPRTLTYDIAPSGTRKAAIELALIAYNSKGDRLNSWTHAYTLGLDPAKLARIMASGITLRLPFDLPAGKAELRIGVYDFKGKRAGSLEVPVDVPRDVAQR